MNKRPLQTISLGSHKHRRFPMLALAAALALTALAACSTTARRTVAAAPIRGQDFYEPPSYLVAWPDFKLLLPPTLALDGRYTALEMRKRGKNLIISGRYDVDETYPKIKYDLRRLGFNVAEATAMKCYWANPDGTLLELTRL